MREIVLGSLLFVLLLAGALPSAFAARPAAGDATPSPSRSPVASGPGFTLCGADESWRRPAAIEEGAPAILYDGTSADGLDAIMRSTGLWSVSDDPAKRPRTCVTQQPQVFLFGYEPVRYDAQDAGLGVLQVRAAPGYRVVVLTGPIRTRLAIVAERPIDELAVPAAWVTPSRN